jgi:3-deoxy-D-manno-octulosonic acid kinase
MAERRSRQTRGGGDFKIRVLMKTNAGRIAIAEGAMLADWDLVGNSSTPGADSIFDPAHWQARNELKATAGGRGASWFVGAGGRWVLRHYRRGGFMARISADRYVWWSEPKVRAFAEWQLHRAMRDLGLPVPKPVGAAYRRSGLSYRCDIITECIQGSRSVSALIAAAALPREAWRSLGGVLARFHRAGIDHADLNAHNILYSEIDAGYHLIDFDRGQMRDTQALGAAWQRGNLDRLHRSLLKVAPPAHFTPLEWQWLLEGYR